MTEWIFVPKNDEIIICKNWLKISPTDGILAPNESAEIEIIIDINVEIAHQILESSSSQSNVRVLFYYYTNSFFML
jgi:hypothetical protein